MAQLWPWTAVPAEACSKLSLARDHAAHGAADTDDFAFAVLGF